MSANVRGDSCVGNQWLGVKPVVFQCRESVDRLPGRRRLILVGTASPIESSGCDAGLTVVPWRAAS